MKYLCDPEVIPAVIPRDLAHLSARGSAAADYCTWLHVDIVDGRFESAVTWPYNDAAQLQELEAFRGLSAIPEHISLEVHLMINDPREMGERFARAGFKRVIAHVEAFASTADTHAALASFRAAGAAEVGLALKLQTPLTMIDEFAGECDVIQLMSIAAIGSQGQAFEDRVLARVEELHANYPDMMVSVDGGVSEVTVEELVRAGANRLVVGHALGDSLEPARTYASIHERAIRGCAPVSAA